jgi:alpha-1,3-rhamnosyl/mannosyltransferase
MVQAAPLRVGIDAHVVGRHKTGNETYVVELASALARRDDIVPIAYVDGDTRWPRPDAPPIGRLRWRSRYVRIPLELPVRARQDRIAALHVQYVAPPVSPVPLVVTVHDLSFVDVPEDLPRAMVWRLRATVALAVRRAAVVLTVSGFTRDRLMEHYGLPEERVVVTPNGVDPRWRPLTVAEQEARLSTAGLTSLPDRFVLAIGAQVPRKNLERLVRAVAAVRAAGEPDLGLVIAGPAGTGTPGLEAEIVRSRAGDWTRMVGYVAHDALVALVGRAAVVAYPSRYEGFGLPVLEAMACRAIVVAADRSSIPEVAGDAAVLVDPDSDDAVAAGIHAALTDTALRTRLAAAGPSRAAAFDWDRCAAATVDGYRRATAR